MKVHSRRTKTGTLENCETGPLFASKQSAKIRGLTCPVALSTHKNWHSGPPRRSQLANSFQFGLSTFFWTFSVDSEGRTILLSCGKVLERCVLAV
jgi:hypothetical protein